MTDDLARKFHQEMIATYHEAARHGYRPTYFLNMLPEYGGVGAAKRLLSKPDEQAGLTSLWELDLLHISVEAHVVKEPWSCLFTQEERQEARRRLLDYGYDPSSP